MNEVQESQSKEGIFAKLKSRIVQYRRVIEVSRKPDREEFTSSARVAAVGILLMGFIGFLIYLAYYMLV